MFNYGFFSYSLDKVKIQCKFIHGKTCFSPFSFLLKLLFHWKYKNIFVDKHPQSSCANSYRYSYSISFKSDLESTFYFAYYWNGGYRSEQREDPNRFIIEYNPNKAGSKIFDIFSRSVPFVITEIKSFDIAYDIPDALPQDCVIDSQCDIMTYGKKDNSTIYISPKEQKSGRIKIYNKRIERSIHGVSIADTLRIECTFKKLSFFDNSSTITENEMKELIKCANRLNSVDIKKWSKDNYNDWLSYALIHLSPEHLRNCLSLMPRNTRSRYKNKIFSETYYNLNLDAITLFLHIVNCLAPFRDYYIFRPLPSRYKNKRFRSVSCRSMKVGDYRE